MQPPEDDGEDWVQRNLPIDPDLEIDESPSFGVPASRPLRAERTMLLVIGSGGVVGALARYAVGRLIQSGAGHFPWSTFWINISGSLVIGFVLILLVERFPQARLARPVLATGFLGAYTTYSTYMVDTDMLFHRHDIAIGILYALSSLFGGLLAVFCGVICGRFMARFTESFDGRLG